MRNKGRGEGRGLFTVTKVKLVDRVEGGVKGSGGEKMLNSQVDAGKEFVVN